MKIAIAPLGRLLPFAFGLTLATAPPGIAAQLSFDRLYVLSDSLSDPGNLFQLSGGQIPPDPPYVEGRFSNGPVWAEYFAQDLNLSPLPVVQLATNPAGATQGINFAFGGANTDSSNGNSRFLPPGSPGFPGVETQVQLYQAFLNGAGAGSTDNALYVYWAGANDYASGGVLDPQGPVGNTRDALNALYDSGARNFLVANLPNLGDTPVGSQRAPVALNQLTAAHNQGLASVLSEFEQARSDARVFSLDINGLFNEVLQTPAEFGFSSTGGCFVFTEFIVNPPDPAALQACGETSVFWDDFHPTTKAHRIVADRALGLLQTQDPPQSVPEGGAIASVLLVGWGLSRLRRGAKLG